MTSATVHDRSATATEGSGPSEDELRQLPGLVSVDDHIVEPPDLWTSHLGNDPEKVPHVVRKQVPRGAGSDELVWADVWVYEDVEVPLIRAFQSVGMAADEVDLVPLTLDECRKGVVDRDARLADMDIDGIEVEVLFPNNFVRFCGQVFLEAKDKKLALECVKIYNDYLLEEWQAPSGERLIASTIVPLWDVELAAAEVRRNAARGGRAVCFSEIPARLGLPSMYSGYWEPLFQACAETDTVVNMHIGSSSTQHTTSPDAPPGVRIANHFSNSAFSLTDWLYCGAFIRYPDLKIAFSEAQAGWIPFLVHRLDNLWSPGRDYRNPDPPLPNPPSHYLRDHVYACVFDDVDMLKHIDVLGEDQICFEADYPHPDGSWPNSRRRALELTATVERPVRDKFLRYNAAKLYRIERVLKELSEPTTGR
ncbi:Predicted metal-dependent hydrolase, TIM-barrel fold [Pseudonocardia thermophila]|jgi:Predicted metal-dependent hydrolase of the TIM-barrel fold|uniref:Predicted metal-dependent hydrolase, TIM-barrel fold n=1 Tax=Pseudonocardia thermophila TaxID=1848 RepID=A0A1M6XPP8_PSETH|nr:amidohydrolase family protein [Pseudonocardia thermophila]SHL07967.1 Predicted metal-dependent hydrolase, TIM-barrel fold [Pseudonocardia thermophila]